MNKHHLSHGEILAFAEQLARRIITTCGTGIINVHPIPRGGIPVAYALKQFLPAMKIVNTPEVAEVFIDDIIDTGNTLKRYSDEYPGRYFFALVDKTSQPEFAHSWIVFPWEVGQKNESATDNITRLLQYIGEDPNREGLLETPHRVIKAWDEWTSGYNKDPAEILKVFEDGGERYDEMVIVRDIPIYSKCEHHLADIFGTAAIAYIPDGRIVGLSKLNRLAEVFSRRLQVQERLTAQIADALETHLKPKGVGVVIRARHMCMESRGINQTGQYTITSALRGVLKEDASARAEFMKLVS